MSYHFSQISISRTVSNEFFFVPTSVIWLNVCKEKKLNNPKYADKRNRLDKKPQPLLSLNSVFKLYFVL